MPKKGKKGVEQRVKGNVKTASSSRASELLGKEAGGGFIGFGAVSVGLAGTSNGGGKREELLQSSGAEFQVVMKQLGKKDPTTKLKALQEFSTLCQREEAEVVIAVLNLWTLMYNKLSMDNDNRVRETSHRALRSCQDKVKGAMGIHLKSIVGCWISGMCDSHGPASTAAQLAFGAAFSVDKQKEVLQYGFDAIFQHAEQMILKESQDTFSDPKTMSEDERLQRYERALVMSIKSLSLTLKKLDMEFLNKKKGSWERVLGEKRTWKLTKHANPSIRGAIFGLISTACEQLPDYVHSKAKLFCTLVLSMLGESDPVVIGPLWESALMVITKTESWDKHVNVQKALLPGLWSLLAAGGYGSAKVTYPCLLPLLSRLIETVYADDGNFPITYLEKIWSGLQADRVRNSRSECEVVMETFLECFMYTVQNMKLSAYFQNELYKNAIEMLMEVVNYGLEKCPAAQTEVIFSSIAKLVGDLVIYQEKNTIFRPHMSNLQLQMGTVCTSALRKADTVQDSASMTVNFTRVGILMKCFHSPPNYIARKPMKTVSFESNSTQNLNPYHLFPDEATTTPKQLSTESSKQFMQPTVCTICADCIAAIVGAPDTNYSQLLLTLLRSFADKILVKSVFSSLDANYYYLMQTHKDRKTLQQKLLILCMLLAKAARLEELSVESAGFTESVLACIVALITFGEIGVDSASMFFEELCKQNHTILPLVLVLLKDCDKLEMYHSLLAACSPVLNGLLNHITNENSIFLERFLHDFFSDVSLPRPNMSNPASTPELNTLAAPASTDRRGSDMTVSIFSTQKIKARRHTVAARQHLLGPESVTCSVINATFSTICNLLNDSFSSSVTEKSLTLHSFKILLKAVDKAVQDTDIAMHHVEDVTKLLGSILHWCLNEMQLTERDMSILELTIECYHSLMTSLPDTAEYIHSLPGLVMEDTIESVSSRQTLQYSLQSSLLFFSLHYKVMNTTDIIWSFYEPFLTVVSKTDESFFPLSALEAFCEGSMLYTPFFNQQTSKSIPVVSSFPTSLTSILYPAAVFCDPKLLVGVFAARKTEGREAERFEHFIEEIISNVLSNSETCSYVEIVCSIKDGQDLKAVHGRSLNQLVMYLCLALGMLQPCQLKNLNQHEVVAREVLQSALGRSLEAVIDHHPQWLETMLEQLIERISSDGPLWVLVMNQLFTSLGKLQQNEERITALKRLTSSLLKEPVCAVLHSALSPLDETVYGEQLGSVLANVENDPCLLVCCIHLLPQNDHLVQSATKALSLIASKQSKSETNLFESLLETCQDPFAFSILELMEGLVKRLKVPSDAWDFILCSLVTLTQMLAEGDSDKLSSVNLTVLASHVYKLCCEVTALFNQPHIGAQQTKEWEEFFQPALQDCLALYFMTTAKAGSHTHGNESSCTTYHNYYLCRAVNAMCSSPENLALEELVEIVVNGPYHQQVAAYTLAKRLFHSMHIYNEDTDASSDAKKTPLRLLALQDMLGKALEKVNMDVVFLEDSLSQSTSLDGSCSYRNTTSYVFIWLLIIDAMSQCDAETRSTLGEWMKDLSQFDHLLQGLFKFLSESSKRSTTLEVTLTPSLSRLAFVAYYSVARHLPSMLRQWFLMVDRQTNALVNQLTTKCISPILQQEELQSFSKRTTNIGNMEIRVHSGVSEISVTYRVDEFSTELFVSLPTSYPLTSPSIREGKRARIDAALWRKWLLQFNIFISNQNGSLMDGILLWKRNLDKHFAGVEDCMICFSVIHSSNYSLPKMLCRTCKKKFHSACLYKWFNTSAKSSCPLCRNIF